MLSNRRTNALIVYLLFFSGSLCFLTVARAQSEEPNVLNSFQKFRNMFGSQDMLKDTFNKVESEKTAREGRLMGVDGETALMLKRMRNPFEPQIPKPVIEEPVIDDTPRPEPEPFDDEPLPYVETKEEIPLPKEDDYIITGIVWNTDRPQAVVNGKIIDIGDHLDYWEVVQIDKFGIEISYREQSFVIKPKGAANVP